MSLSGERGDLRAGVFYDLNTSIMIQEHCGSHIVRGTLKTSSHYFLPAML